MMIWFALVRWYAWLFGWCHDHWRINLRGLGFLLRRLRMDAILNVQGVRMLMEAGAAMSYSRLLSGQWNEPETHVFLKRVAQKIGPVAFWDVGANVGEMVLDMARAPHFAKIVAFEPDPTCVRAMRVGMQLNDTVPGFQLFEVIAAAVGCEEGLMYLLNAGNPQASMVMQERPGALAIPVVTLDGVLQKQPVLLEGSKALVLLIDVEGHELEVLKGAQLILQTQHPLVIFEFNHISRQHFTLTEMQAVLGEAYVIKRLNRSGALDDDLTNTWNCVAVPRKFIEMI
jgi:FkbM family methyltransferase